MLIKAFFIASRPPASISLTCFTLSSICTAFGWVQLVFWVLGVFFFFDAFARYREYVQLVILLDADPVVSDRTIKYFRSSYCRRWAAVKAGVPLKSFEDLGYRWYHIWPDDCPQCFLRAGFWRNFFGTKKDV